MGQAGVGDGWVVGGNCVAVGGVAWYVGVVGGGWFWDLRDRNGHGGSYHPVWPDGDDLPVFMSDCASTVSRGLMSADERSETLGGPGGRWDIRKMKCNLTRSTSSSSSSIQLASIALDETAQIVHARVAGASVADFKEGGKKGHNGRPGELSLRDSRDSRGGLGDVTFMQYS